jgi:hypothetical protein
VPYIVKSLLNVKEDGGTYFLSFYAFFYFVDDSVALLDCGMIGLEANLLHGDDVIKKCSFFRSPENKSFKYFG